MRGAFFPPLFFAVERERERVGRNPADADNPGGEQHPLAGVASPFRHISHEAGKRGQPGGRQESGQLQERVRGVLDNHFIGEVFRLSQEPVSMLRLP